MNTATPSDPFLANATQEGKAFGIPFCKGEKGFYPPPVNTKKHFYCDSIHDCTSIQLPAHAIPIE